MKITLFCVKKMSKFIKVLIILLSSLFFASIIFWGTVDKILPKIRYDNLIEFDVAFLNTDEKLIVFFQSQNSIDMDYQIFDIKASQNLHHFSLLFSYSNLPNCILLFGNGQKVNFLFANLSINGKKADIDLVNKEIINAGYNTTVKNNSIYAIPGPNLETGEIDLYKVSDSFINIDQNTLNGYLEQDRNLRIYYFIALVIFFTIVFKIISVKFAEHLSDRIIFNYALTLQIVIFILAIFLVHNNEIDIFRIENLFVLKNHLLIVVLPLFLFAVYVRFPYKFVKTCVFFTVTIFIFVVGLDHFAEVVFGSRYFFETTTKFAHNLSDSLPFFLSYVSSYSGLYFLISFSLTLILYFIPISIFANSVFFKKSLHIVSLLLVLSLLLTFIYNKNQYSKFYNVIQVNVNGLFTEGDFKRPYLTYKPYSISDLGYESFKGLNKKENVIVILVESLACDVTYLCGNTNNYAPYIQKLAKENIWYPNYYSNNFHTNGAIFTITTGLPLINGPHGEDTFFNKNLYHNDFINEFSKNGYITAYYTPAPLVLNKGKQLDVSNYSYMSTGEDKYYDQKDKSGVFGSVSDEEMFNKIIHDLRNAKQPVMFMLTTVSTHTPYITPWGSHDVPQSYAYTDMVLKKFIDNLEKINYFDHGIIVLTGDHKGWGNSNKNYSIREHQLPLIVINGKDHGVVRDGVSFSHSSLGVMLEYLMLPKYEKNKYQINPWTDLNGKEFILNYDAQKANTVLVKYGKKEDEILLDGDQTRFIGSEFSDEEQRSVLGFISYLRQ